MYQESYTSHNPVIKFKLDVEAFSDVHKISFVLWDRDCIELVGITAADLSLGRMIHWNILKCWIFFMNKTYALRIKVQPKYKQASVLGYRFDVDTISKVEDQLLGDENTSKMENNQSPINNQVHKELLKNECPHIVVGTPG
ncbi:hypothetical protein QL285_068643 [Trifolium repens]|nr:hypothetical protein QL285_068643 [Trifolium repens]